MKTPNPTTMNRTHRNELVYWGPYFLFRAWVFIIRGNGLACQLGTVGPVGHVRFPASQLLDHVLSSRAGLPANEGARGRARQQQKQGSREEKATWRPRPYIGSQGHMKTQLFGQYLEVVWDIILLTFGVRVDVAATCCHCTGGV